MKRRLALLVLAMALPLGSSGAQAPRADSIARSDTVIPNHELFHRSDLYVAGGFAAATIALFPLDRHLAQLLRDENLVANANLTRASKFFRFFGGPGPLIIGPAVYVVGRVGQFPHIAELGLHGTEAVIVGSVTAGIIKAAVGRARPYVSRDSNPHSFGFGRGLRNSDYKSFPSGHTTAAFSAAAAVTAETAEWWPRSTIFVAPLMYGGATIVGLSRMYDDQHWASDVVMGAAIGTFAGLKTVRFNHTHAGNAVDRVLLGARVVPTTDGLALAWSGSF